VKKVVEFRQVLSPAVFLNESTAKGIICWHAKSRWCYAPLLQECGAGELEEDFLERG
jgi:hypothetical protein